LPEQPWQTKYPPLFPLLLSLVWRIAPEFPANLKIATVLCWLMTPPLMWLIRILYRRYGFPAWWAWVMVAALAVNPYLQLFSTSLLSEALFTLLLLGVLLVAPRSALIAGLLAGLAYLTRTAALPLAVAVPAVYSMRREWRKAVLFVAAMFPFLAGWALWVKSHMAHSSDAYLLYYVDYVGYRSYVVNGSNFLKIVWSNFDSLLNSVASIVAPFSGSGFAKMLAQTIGVGILIGVYRLARDRAEVQAYAIYGALSAAMLVVWHYPPTPRFLFPLYPLLLAGFAYQVARTCEIVRKAYADPRQRRASVVFASVLVLGAVFLAKANWSFMFEVAPETQNGYRKLRVDNMAASRRINAELPGDAGIMAGNDGLIYLLTGRRGMSMMLPVNLWYEGRPDEMVERERAMPQVAREHGLDYFYVNRAVKGDFSDDVHRRVLSVFDASPQLHREFTTGEAILYRVLR
jgi:hypothetical protein